MYMKLSSNKTNNEEEFVEGLSAYFDSAMIEGQQPALKGFMRAKADAIYCWPKIKPEIIEYLRMRLNYQNSSNFGHDSAYLWFQLLHRYFSDLKMKICFKGYSTAKTLLIAFRTYYKRVSLSINPRVIYATGEVSFSRRRDGRGFVVPILQIGKGPKYFTLGPYGPQVRSHTTKSGIKSLAPVQEQPEIPKGLQILANHWKISFLNSKRVFYDLRGILKQESIWFAAYLKLKNNKGSETPGPDEDIIDSLTKQRILEIREAVLKNEFSWKGVREITIPKPGKPGKLRPLGIPSINDRLVQEVIRTIIEPIYELDFHNQSYGFRPNRGCHTALKWMNTNMKDSIWFIEGDIKSYFPSIDHKTLMKLLEKRIQDPTILKLIRTGLKAKVYQKDNLVYKPEIGTPQGGILSPLLSNIYLNELDRFMEKLCQEYQGSVLPSNRKKNPLANKLLRAGLKSEYYRMRIPSRIPNETDYRNCKYIRYADDFLIGILGPRSIAIEVRNKVKEFLRDELKIELNMEKTKITHISNGIEFLGYKFSRKQIFIKQSYGGHIVNRKMTIPTLDVNMKRVISRLSEANLCTGDGQPIPAFRFLRLPQSLTNQKVNYILRGLSEWWSIAGNRKAALARVAYIIRYSIAKVYAAKFKLKTVSAVFKIGGNDLSRPIGVKAKSIVGADEGDTPQARKKKLVGILFDRYHKIPKPKSNKIKPTWNPEYLKLLEKEPNVEKFIAASWTSRGKAATNPLASMAWRLETSLSSQGAPCVICGSYDDVQMHHVRALKDIEKYKNASHRHMIAIQRKQIPFCRTHHLELHKGNWSNKPTNFKVKPSSVGEPCDG
uniref:Group II intron reverse transcriptase/maturase n=1 Tax=Amanita thiersii TaxID=235537 RepID=A0A5Q0N396_9AGAR|nr:group II intron reverse transcriptase/maturase [Amanita thiersii]QFZ98699.1 group II intron reverse transcriptase/maturase [Amanita thiersii]